MTFTTATAKNKASNPATQKRIIDLTDSLADLTANIIYDSEHYLLPSDIFEDAILGAINDLIDDACMPIVPISTLNRSI